MSRNLNLNFSELNSLVFVFIRGWLSSPCYSVRPCLCGETSIFQRCSAYSAAKVLEARGGFPMTRLPEPVFQLNRALGLFIAVFHDYRSIEGKAPLRRFSFIDGPRSWHYYGVLRYHQRPIGAGAINLLPRNVIDGGGAGEDHSCT